MDQAQTEPQGNKLVLGARNARQFLLEAKAELNKVVWPTREELLDATKRVILMTLLIGTIIGLLDLVLKKILVDGVSALIR